MGPAGDARPTGAGARCAAPVALRRGKHGGTQPWALTIPVTRSPPRPPWIPGSPGPAGQAAPDPEVMGVPGARRSVRRWCAASWDQLRPWGTVRCLPGGGEAWSPLRRGRPPRHASDWSGAQDRCRAGRSPGRAARRCSIPIGSRVHDRYRESPAQRTRAGTTLAHAARAGLAPSTPLGAHSCGRD
jgi:hypothetical protein